MATRKTPATDRDGTVVTHTTATVLGHQQATTNIHAAGTDAAQMIVTFGRFMLVFRSAAAVHGLIQGFAAARTLLGPIGHQAPPVFDAGDDYARAALSVAFLKAPEYALTPGQQYSPARRRTVHWINIHMGPITWRIIDRTGSTTMLDELRIIYRTATAVFPDGELDRRNPFLDPTPDAFDEAEHDEAAAADPDGRRWWDNYRTARQQH